MDFVKKLSGGSGVSNYLRKETGNTQFEDPANDINRIAADRFQCLRWFGRLGVVLVIVGHSKQLREVEDINTLEEDQQSPGC